MFGKRNILVTYHPETLSSSSSKDEFSTILAALELQNEINFIFTSPNADTDGRIVIDMINDFVNKNSPEGRGESFNYQNYAKDSELTFSYMHGGMDTNLARCFSVVPANTLICFASPVDNLYTISTQDQFNIGLNYSDMSADMYIEIFR